DHRCLAWSGTGPTAAGSASQELDALPFDARREPTVAFLVGPGVVDQATDDEDGVSPLQFAGCLCQLAPDVDVNVAGALLVLASATAEAFVDGHAEARHGTAVGRVPHVCIARQVADDHHLVEGVAEPVLALRVNDRCVVAARTEREDLDA